MEKTNDDVDAHIASTERTELMTKLDELISQALPNLERTLWRGVFWGGTEQAIIGYGDLVYRRPKKPVVEWFIVGLAEQKNYVSVYVSGHENGENLAKIFGRELGKVKVGASNVAIKDLADLNIESFQSMIRRAYELAPKDS